MQGGKNWILPKYINANRFFWDSHWLEIWSNHFCPSMGLNGGSVATDSEAVRHEREISKNWILPKETKANWFFWDSHLLEIWSNHLFPSMQCWAKLLLKVTIISYRYRYKIFFPLQLPLRNGIK